eukprot:5912923-Pyramimonas_sp.AAC.1
MVVGTEVHSKGGCTVEGVRSEGPPSVGGGDDGLRPYGKWVMGCARRGEVAWEITCSQRVGRSARWIGWPNGTGTPAGASGARSLVPLRWGIGASC